MDDKALTAFLEKQGLDLNKLLKREIPRTAFSKWTIDRRQLAAKQIMCRMKGIDVGEVDGLLGPQTREAFDQFDGKSVDRAKVEKENFSKIKTLEEVELKPVWPLQKDVMKYYGAVGKNQGRITLPFPMKLAWDKTHVIKTVTLHEKVCDSANRVFQRIADAYTPQQRVELGLDLFGGSLNVRKMRGGNVWSMHSWGIAIDFDPERNQLRMTRLQARLGKPDAEMFWKLWEEEGWLSLGRARNYDFMHVQAARL
jgi:hypothetical protein